jgi:Rrf2 family transcriptional regulator, nitric oxide-sensitive transcriptional repressor
VVNTVEPIRRIRQCPLGIAAHGARLCPLHARLDSAMEMIENAFRGASIADVLSEPSGSRPLCRIAGVHHVA